MVKPQGEEDQLRSSCFRYSFNFNWLSGAVSTLLQQCGFSTFEVVIGS